MTLIWQIWASSWFHLSAVLVDMQIPLRENLIQAVPADIVSILSICSGAYALSARADLCMNVCSCVCSHTCVNMYWYEARQSLLGAGDASGDVIVASMPTWLTGELWLIPGFILVESMSRLFVAILCQSIICTAVAYCVDLDCLVCGCGVFVYGFNMNV